MIIRSWRTTLIGVGMLGVGAYIALTGGDIAVTGLFLSTGTGFILAKDSGCS